MDRANKLRIAQIVVLVLFVATLALGLAAYFTDGFKGEEPISEPTYTFEAINKGDTVGVLEFDTTYRVDFEFLS